MNALFGNKKPGFQPNKPKIRVERIRDVPKPAPLPSVSAAKNRPTALLQRKKSINNIPVRGSAQSSRAGSIADEDGRRGDGNTSSSSAGGLKVRKRKAGRQISPVHQRLESDSEDDGGEVGFAGYEGTENKRRRERGVDKERRLRCEKLAERTLEMTHQADIEIDGVKVVEEDVVKVKFQYPNAVQRERYVFQMFVKEGSKVVSRKANMCNPGTIYYLAKMQSTPRPRSWRWPLKSQSYT